MVSTRNALKQSGANLDESMGVREVELRSQLSPVPSAKDVGRTPLRKFGRVKVDQIIADPNQPRVKFDQDELQRLASSIRNTGQLHPIRVRWDDDAAKWIIVTGERRYRATVAAELPEIDCYFLDGEITESEILEQQLVENLLRQDLKPLEEARGYANLMTLNHWNGKQVAEALRVSASKVSRALALLDLSPGVQQRIESGEITRSAAYELCKLDNESVQTELAEKAASGNLTQKAASKAVRQRKGKKGGKPRGTGRADSGPHVLRFPCPHGIEIVVRIPRGLTYDHLVEAKDDFVEEVEHRAKNRVALIP